MRAGYVQLLPGIDAWGCRTDAGSLTALLPHPLPISTCVVFVVQKAGWLLLKPSVAHPLSLYPPSSQMYSLLRPEEKPKKIKVGWDMCALWLLWYKQGGGISEERCPFNSIESAFSANCKDKQKQL